MATKNVWTGGLGRRDSGHLINKQTEGTPEVTELGVGLLEVAQGRHQRLLHCHNPHLQVSLLCISCRQLLPHRPQALGCIQPRPVDAQVSSSTADISIVGKAGRLMIPLSSNEKLALDEII